jgi:hypothetical protein
MVRVWKYTTCIRVGNSQPILSLENPIQKFGGKLNRFDLFG